jgi:hypothetical protein
MSDEPVAGTPETDAADGSTSPDKKKKKKKKDKTRSAWISFFGRITAQIVGAVASVALGLMVVKKYHAGVEGRATVAPRAQPAAARVGDAQGRGTTSSLAVLPLANFSGDAR